MATRTVRNRAVAKPAKIGIRQQKVLVRMYNVGFGDCFLIEFPKGENDVSRVLIDCGSVAAGALAMDKIVDAILADVMEADGAPRIDAVICTHRHADHVSGFADPRWKDLKVAEVWFPWTENPEDKDAKRIRETQSRLAAALQAHWQAKLAASGDHADENAQWLSMSLNALSNEKAMTLLHRGFNSNPRRLFLSSDGSPTHVDTDALPGVSVVALGPSKDEAVMREMDPPPGKTYLRQIADPSAVDGPFEPFGEIWQIDPAQYRTQFNSTHLPISSADEKKLRNAASEWDPAITVALEKAVNGTSLVLAFEIGDTVLFFPGDAQWGTWNMLLNNPETVQLLSRANFWKVGHHGSHNATPTSFVSDTVHSSCCAMMSTKTGKWNTIPRQGLLAAIEKKGIALARSDIAPAISSPKFVRKDDARVETWIPLSG